MCTPRRLRCLLSGVALLLPVFAAGQGSETITVVSPSEGQVVAAGEVVPVIVDIDGSLDPVEVSIIPSFSAGEIADHIVPFPYELGIEVPEQFYGSAFLEIYARTPGEDLPKAKKIIHFKVEPDSPVTAVLTTRQSFVLFPPPHSRSTARLSVKASLANQQLVDAEFAGIPVTFQSDDVGVATVSAEGVISAIAPGQAWVTVHVGNLVSWVAVSVRDPTTGMVSGPTDISSDVAILSTGFRVDPETNHIVELIRVTNISTGPLHKPFTVVVDSLPEGVVVLSPDGRTRAVTPVGAPFMFLSREEGDVHFMPGDSATVEVRYLNPAGRPITRNVRVFNGNGP